MGIPDFVQGLFLRVENMSLIKCPECGREISDQAVSCPGCGYSYMVEKRNKKNTANHDLWMRSKKNICIVGVVVITFIILIVLMMRNNIANPFAKIYKGMPQQEVRSVFGEPDEKTENSKDYVLIDEYFNKSFCGVRGCLCISYSYDTKDVEYAYWHIEIPSEKSLENYSSKIEKITKGLAKICGGEDAYDVKEWEDFAGKQSTRVWKDSTGNEYNLTIYKTDKTVRNNTIPDYIYLGYSPADF